MPRAMSAGLILARGDCGGEYVGADMNLLSCASRGELVGVGADALDASDGGDCSANGAVSGAVATVAVAVDVAVAAGA